MKTVITAKYLFTPTERIDAPMVTIEESRITAVASQEHAELPANAAHFDFPGMVLAPGFIDIHIHGGSDLPAATDIFLSVACTEI